MGLSRVSNLLYRQQFIIGPRYVDEFESWKKLEISQSLFLTSHPDLNICQIESGVKALTLIGYLIDGSKPFHGNEDILTRILRDHDDQNGTIKATSELCGNWVLIYKNHDNICLFHDCTGARSVFYNDVKKANDLWFASQPRLISSILDLKEDKKAIDFIKSQKSRSLDYWWPGDTSPYSEIKSLLPNHYFDLKQGTIKRYWPDCDLKEIPKTDAIDKISIRLKGIMLAASHRFDMALALSCGLDSRVLLSACKDIKEKICVYNGKRPEMSKKHPDIAISKRLSSKLDFTYHYIPQSRKIDSEFAKLFEMNAPYGSVEIIPGLEAELKYFERKKVGVTGNILEVARFYYKKGNSGENLPDGEYLASITKMKDSSFAIAAFQNWLSSVKKMYNVDLYDLFYWEQRCGRWLSNNCLAFLTAWEEVFFPFNCRSLLVDLLSVSASYRMPKEYSFFNDLIKNIWPDVLSEPINPKQEKGLLARSKQRVTNLAQRTRLWVNP